jgi:hypothetical protein
MENKKLTSNALSQEADFCDTKAQHKKATTPTKDQICPNCGALLESQKCKLICPTAGCGYRVTCSEW